MINRGGEQMPEEYGRLDILDIERRSVKVSLNGNDGDIFAGGNGINGDLALFRRDIANPNRHDQATIHLSGREGNAFLGGNGVDGELFLRNRDGVDRIYIDAGHADMWIGGNGRNGDIVMFPESATDIRDPDQATIRLTGGEGNLNLRGNIKFTSPVAIDDQLPGWSVEEGTTAAFQGSQRSGLVDFTHTHAEAAGDREKLLNVWIFNPELTDDSLVLLTAHAGAPCLYMVSELTSRHGICGGIGHFIHVRFAWKIVPDTRVRIKYYILN
jgi:hypothetical protein